MKTLLLAFMLFTTVARATNHDAQTNAQPAIQSGDVLLKGSKVLIPAGQITLLIPSMTLYSGINCIADGSIIGMIDGSVSADEICQLYGYRKSLGHQFANGGGYQNLISLHKNHFSFARYAYQDNKPRTFYYSITCENKPDLNKHSVQQTSIQCEDVAAVKKLLAAAVAAQSLTTVSSSQPYYDGNENSNNSSSNDWRNYRCSEAGRTQIVYANSVDAAIRLAKGTCYDNACYNKYVSCSPL